MTKFKDIPTNSNPATGDFVVGVSSTGVDQKSPLTILLQTLYPVGSLYFNAAVGTNPTSLLGFGTWVAHAAGKVLVGIDPTDGDFDAVGDTGGEKTHTLSYDEMPVHSHGVYDPGHSHSSANGQQVAIQASSTNKLSSTGNAAQITWGNTQTSNNGSNIGIYNAGSGLAHNNMPPYVAVYIWRRTA